MTKTKDGPETVEVLSFLRYIAAFGLIAMLGPQSVTMAQGQIAEKPCEGEGRTKILVRVYDLRSSDGLVTVEWFDDNPKGFVKKLGRLERIRVGAADNQAEACFWVAGPGTYAIALYHDENGNKKFDKNFFGIPTEGFGFSNNPKVYFGVPDHSEAAFAVDSEPVELKINVQYL